MICIILVIALIFALYRIALLSLKVGYYEQTLKNNSRHFSEDRLEQINNIMNLKNPFKKL